MIRSSLFSRGGPKAEASAKGRSFFPSALVAEAFWLKVRQKVSVKKFKQAKKSISKPFFYLKRLFFLSLQLFELRFTHVF